MTRQLSFARSMSNSCLPFYKLLDMTLTGLLFGECLLQL